MTAEQKAVLTANIDGDGSSYRILTIEYPASYPGNPGGNDGLKIVTQGIESDLVDVDVYDPEGRTTHYSYWARAA